MVRNVDSPSKFLMYPRFLQVMINAQVYDLSSHTTKYTSFVLTQKVFANIRRIGKGFSGVETPLFDTMLVQPQVQDAAEVKEDEDDIEALEITKLKHRVKRLKTIRRSKSSGFIEVHEELDANEDVTLVDVDIAIEIDADTQERMEEDVTPIKEINAVKPEPTVFNDEEEKEDLDRAKVLQQQYDQKQENIDWNIVAEQMQEKHLDNIKKYQSLKRKPISVRPIFKREYNHVQTFLKSDRDEEPAKKRAVEEILLQESFKKLRTEVEASVVEFKVKALQVKYPLIDWEIYSEGSRITKEKFSTAMPTHDKEKALWAELTRLYEPNVDDVFWKLQRYMHYPIIWKLHSNNKVHQVSLTTRRLQVEEDSEVARDLVMKIFMKANQPKSKSLDTSSN
nr:hypothetical protein [Tanacetum cinerariifolium]